MIDNEEKIDLDLLKKHAADLGEHFDSVQIIVTKHESDEIGTVFAHQGAGDYYARLGAVTEWLTRQEELARLRVQAQEDDDS